MESVVIMWKVTYYKSLLLHYYTLLTAFFQDNLGKPVPER